MIMLSFKREAIVSANKPVYSKKNLASCDDFGKNGAIRVQRRAHSPSVASREISKTSFPLVIQSAGS